MKIVLLSYAFSPGVGGIETVSKLLVDGFRARGHEVIVVTHTPAAPRIAESDEHVLRRPSALKLLAALRWSDAVVQSNVSIGLAWPLELGMVKRPWVVVNHTPISRPSGKRTWRDHLKMASLARAHVYAVSEYLRSVTLKNSRIMRNPYDVTSFYTGAVSDMVARDRELLFVGRVVRAKGLDVLIEALHLLKQRGQRFRLSIAGDGDERSMLEARVVQLGMSDQVEWLGIVKGKQLGDVMRRHVVVVLPSRPEPPEALPLVPLESIACGCLVIASRQGGLPESVGPCGLLVEPEDPEALADAIVKLLMSPEMQQRFLDAAPGHLRPFHPDAVIGDYEAAIHDAAH